MFHFRTMIVCLLIVAKASIITARCPHRCTCFNNTMDCSHSRLKIVPQDYGSNYDKIQTMICNLSHNSIRSLEKKSFQYTLNLREIYLPYNKIYFIHEESFSELKDLQVIVLSDNQIEHIHIDTFINNACLLHLDLHNNSELYIPRMEHFLDIPSLVSLILCDCNINSIWEKTFATMINLKYLNIRNNRLKTIDPGVFRFLPHLKQLEVAGNDLVCNCAIEHVEHSIRNMNVCVVGRKCYNNDTALPTDWDDLHLECPISSSVNQAIEKYTFLKNIQTTANCSKVPDLLNMLKIPNHCEKNINVSMLDSKTNNNTSRNITTSTGSVFLSGKFIFPITMTVFCACMVAIICILYRKSLRRTQMIRDIELIEEVATAVVRKETDQGEGTSRYSGTPSLPNSARQYHGLSLNEINRMYLENHRPPSSEESYLVPRECENKDSSEAKQYFEKRRNPTRRLNFEPLPFPESQLHLQKNTSPSCAQLLTYNSSSASYCSDYHIYEEID